MKILILGHGQHGKDEAAKLLEQMYGFTFESSSRAAFEHAIWPALQDDYIRSVNVVTEQEFHRAKEQCYEDRRVRRQEWKQLISEFNTPDKARLTKIILETSDIYVGMRCHVEYAASKHLFDKVLWVSRPGEPVTPDMTIEYDAATMTPVVNLNTQHWEELMQRQLIKVFGAPI